MSLRRGVLGCVLVAALVAPASAQADAVTQWHLNARAAIFAENPTAHYSTLSFAMVQGAVYDAVNGIAGGYQPYLVKPVVAPGGSLDAAVATAAYRVLVAVVPASQVAAHTLLAQQYQAALTAVPNGAAKTAGISAGEIAAAAMLAARANDGRNPTTPFPFVFGTSPGVWRVSPPSINPEGTPWVGNVKPFLVPDVTMLRTRGPNPLRSLAYTIDYWEVKLLGSIDSRWRTQDQTNAAIWWQSQPHGLYGNLMTTLSERYGLSTPDRARLFARMSLAAADAAIGCWNDKYYWNFWRPIDAIRLGDTDGNPFTFGDAGWRPLFDPATATVPPLSTPTFPDHPSGHSCVSGATFAVLEDFFGTDDIEFSILGTRFPNTQAQTRHFDSFSEALDEVVDARVWGGIHFRTADVQGVGLGKKVAAWERDHWFQRT